MSEAPMYYGGLLEALKAEAIKQYGSVEIYLACGAVDICERELKVDRKDFCCDRCFKAHMKKAKENLNKFKARLAELVKEKS